MTTHKHYVNPCFRLTYRYSRCESVKKECEPCTPGAVPSSCLLNFNLPRVLPRNEGNVYLRTAK